MSKKFTLFGIPFNSEELQQDALSEIKKWLITAGYYDDEDFTDINELLILDYCAWYNINDKKLLDFIFYVVKTIRTKTDTTITDELIINNIIKHLMQMTMEDFEKDTHIKVEEFYMSRLKRDEATDRFASYMESIYNDDGSIMRKGSINPHLQNIETTIVVEIEKELKLKLTNYKPAGTDERLSQEEKRRGILNTIRIIEEAILESLKIPKIEYKPLEITEYNLTYTDGRNQKLEQLIKLLQNANANYVLKDDKNDFFYPFIANIFFTQYITQKHLEKNRDIIKALKEVEYASRKMDTLPIEITNNDIKKVLMFHKDVNFDQVWRYTTTLYAHKYNTDFKSMSKLIKFFIYENPKIYNKSLIEPIPKLPDALTDIDRFTKDFIE